MVAISLTHDNVKEMANRLRQFLAAGGTSIKQTHAYEALAKSLGYRDWNTLLGVLESTGSASQDIVATAGETAGRPSSAMPGMLLLIDRHAMAAHGVTVTHIEAAFRREFPTLLETRSQRETLCHEQNSEPVLDSGDAVVALAVRRVPVDRADRSSPSAQSGSAYDSRDSVA